MSAFEHWNASHSAVQAEHLFTMDLAPQEAKASVHSGSSFSLAKSISGSFISGTCMLLWLKSA